MFQKKSKKPPPRPPPPNFMKYKSKSSYNLASPVPVVNLIDWSPPNSPKVERPSQFHGSVSSSFSSSTSSIASSKKSVESDSTPFNWFATTSQTSQTKENSALKPRIIRPGPAKKGRESSPPMPLVPPPTLPRGHYDVVTSYGIALFDFAGTQPGDLSLQVNDVVELIRRVNGEWLYGKVCDREGIFPENFLQIEVPLPGENRVVSALYDFRPEVEGDLELRVGQKVKVIKEISSDWLFGESEGRTGQFPRNFVS